MSYSDGYIKCDHGVDPKIGVSVRDVQQALGTNVADVGNLCKHANINPMAKYKPIRNSKKEMLSPQNGSTPSDRYLARFGFSTTTPTLTFSGNNSPHAVWEYLKPRGKDNNEPYRLTDFANEANPTSNGYNAAALPPFAIEVESMEMTADPTEEGDGGVGIKIYINSGVNSYFPGGGFESATCMTITELLNLYDQGAYLGFAIRDISADDKKLVCVVTRYQLRNLDSSVPTVTLYSKNMPASGDKKFSPKVPILYDYNRAGNTFRFIAFLWNNFPSFVDDYGNQRNASNAEYSVCDFVPNGALSLEFVNGIDRSDVVAYLAEGGIIGLTGFIESQSITLTLDSSYTNAYGIKYYRYRIGGVVYGTFYTPQGHWNPDGDVRIRIIVTGNGIMSYVDTNTGNCEYEKSIDMHINNHTYPNNVIKNFSAEPAYMDVDEGAANEGAYIQITAYAKPSYLDTQRVPIDGLIRAEAPGLKYT